MEVLHYGRRKGKTTLALKMLRDSDDGIMICHIGNKAHQMKNENKDVSHRIFNAYSPKIHLSGIKFNKAIIDDADCIPLSTLLEWINWLQERNINITITTSV